MLKKATLILLAVCFIAGGILTVDIYRSLFSPLSISQTTEFHLAPGTSMKALGQQLQSAKIIDCPFYVEWYARLTGLDARLKAGEYEINAEQSAADLLQVMERGEVRLHAFTIVEGWSFAQLRVALSKEEMLNQDISMDRSDAAIMAALGLPDQHPEGRFYPDTYFFPRGLAVSKFLIRAHTTMQQILQQQWQQRSQGLPLKNEYEVLILASIVEKETAVAEERPLIAAVFINRLRKRMRLQTDPTVIYGLGDSYKGDIRFRDLRNDTPYNTYTRAGLPPTPIAMPGEASINAVLHPAESNALYFVARGDGSHYFSATLEEHNAAVDQYQRKRRPL